MSELIYGLVLPMVVLTVVAVIVLEYFFPGATAEQVGFCPDGETHRWRDEYYYDNAGGEYTITSCGRCGSR